MAAERGTGTSLGLLFVRLALGVIFIAHGVRKISGEGGIQEGIQNFSDSLASLGVPLPYAGAVAAITAEILGGLIIIVGLGALSRLAALSLAFLMIVAITMVHRHDSFFLEVDATKGPHWGTEYNIALLAMALCILFAGPGKIGLLSGGKGGKGGGGPPKP
jgi:putative oxidoreductase